MSGWRILDFGKVIDSGLADPGARDAYLRGDHQHADPAYSWDDGILCLVRLWAAAGVLVYALARGLSDFADHGYNVLAELGDRGKEGIAVPPVQGHRRAPRGGRISP